MSEVCCPVLILGALSDERSGLSFVSLSLWAFVKVKYIFTFCCPGSVQQIMPYYLQVAHATTAVQTLERSYT
jgi:hypothetical protein